MISLCDLFCYEISLKALSKSANNSLSFNFDCFWGFVLDFCVVELVFDFVCIFDSDGDCVFFYF